MVCPKEGNLGSAQLNAKEKRLLRNFLENLSISHADPRETSFGLERS